MSKKDSLALPGTDVKEWLDSRRQTLNKAPREGEIQINIEGSGNYAARFVGGVWVSMTVFEAFKILKQEVSREI